MKNFFLIIVVLICVCCSPDSLSDCIGNEGKKVIKHFDIDEFSTLNVYEGVEVKLIQDTITYLEVNAGEHIISSFDFVANADTLNFKNNLTCSLGYTKPIVVTVHFKNMTKIYSNTQFKIYSEDYLNLNHLEIHQGLIGNNASGDFNLKINANTLLLSFNTNSFFKLNGVINNFAVYNWGGGSRIEADNLICNKIEVLHRGFNNFYFHALDEIKGDIYGIGNIYLKGNPSSKDVRTYYSGKLIE